MVDFTDRLRSEQEASLTAALLASTNDAAMAINLDGRITYWNRGAEELFQTPAREALKNSIYEVSPSGAASARENLARLRAGEPVPPFESTLTRRDGSKVPIYITVAPILDRQARLSGTSAIIKDITQLKRAQEANIRAAAMLESASDSIIAFTPDGVITDWNKGAERLFGAPASRVLGHNFFQLDPNPEYLEEMRVNLDRGRAGQPSVPNLRKVTRRDGTELTVYTSISPIRDANGTLVGFSAISQDVTQQKQAEEALRALSAGLINLLEQERIAISRELHDALGQELTGLKLGLELMARDLTKVNEGGLRESIVQTQSLLEQVRSIAVDLRPPMLERNGLGPALRALIERFEERMQLQVTLTNNLNGKQVSAETALATYRIVQEALTNVARHAHVKAAHVRLRVRERRLVVEIEDAGTGFATVQVLGTPAAIGLAGMAERARTLGGTVRIDSRRKAGTLVTAELPLIRPRKRPKKQVTAGRQAAR